MTTEEDYSKKLTFNLRYEEFVIGQEADGLLPVELDGQKLCCATIEGGLRYREKDVFSGSRRAAPDRITAITRTTAEYMDWMGTAPQLTASTLTGDNKPRSRCFVACSTEKKKRIRIPGQEGPGYASK